MDFGETLADFKKKADREIAKYLDEKIASAKKEDMVSAQALEYVKKFALAGGKRIRPALMHYSYLGSGGKEMEKIIKASIGIELIHLFLLIHDDIIDNDSKRHGMDTINARYEKIGKRIFFKKDNKHFGNSMGIMIGDMVNALGNDAIFSSGFPADLVMKALSKVQGIVSFTVVGEMKDVYIEYRNKASEKEIMKMYEYKTAKYTIEGPLHLGAVLGGASDEFCAKLSRYAVPVGIAFQIQDDILGIFGSEKKLGKGVGSDIAEGKKTILVVKALEKSSGSDRKKLQRILGDRNLNAEKINQFRNIIINTGSLEYAENLAGKLVLEGKEALEEIKIAPAAKDFLLGMADYMTSRQI